MSLTDSGWNEKELQCAILQILLDARKKKPKSGGASQKLMADILDIDGDPPDLTPIINQLLADKLIEQGQRLFQITPSGVDWTHEFFNKRNPDLAPVILVLQTVAASEIGMTAREIEDAHSDIPLEQLEFALWYFVQSKRIQVDESRYKVTDAGRQYLN